MKLSAFITSTDAQPADDGWLAHCPAHADEKPSLRIAVGERKLLLKCRAGCPTVPPTGENGHPTGEASVLGALGLSLADLPRVPDDIDEQAPRARSTSAPASTAAVAALAAKLDGWHDELADGPLGLGAGSVLTYATDRFGLTADDVSRLRLGAAQMAGGWRLVVPFLDAHGVTRGYQARAVDPALSLRWTGPPSPDGGSWAKIGIFRGDSGWPQVVVTEGPGDALTACAAGYDAVAVRGAALAARPEVAEEIAAYAGRRPVVVFGDADDAGVRFARTLVGNLAAAGARSVVGRLPEGIASKADLTSWRESSPDRFAGELQAAVTAAEESAPSTVSARLGAIPESDRTDLGAAVRLREWIEGAGAAVHWVPEVGWHILSRGVWKGDDTEAHRTAAQESAGRLWAEVEELAVRIAAMHKPESSLLADLRALRVHAQWANSSRGLSAAIREMQALPGVSMALESFDRHPHLLAVANGVVDLRTGELSPHDPALLLTRRLDVSYNPDATSPRWDRFLREVMPSHTDEMVSYLQRLVGYGITGLTSEQCFVVLYGTGANGKSIFTDALSRIFEPITKTTPFSTFEQSNSGGIPNDIAALRSARLVMASEGEAGKPMSESVLKRVTGSDVIVARFLRKEFFEFRPQFLLFLATNHKPNFRGQDEGLWRRVKLVEWARFFRPEEREPEGKLKADLMAESEGILSWAVRGAVEWHARGLQDPDPIRKATADYRETSNALAGFLPGEFDITECDDDRVSGHDLFDAYVKWCESENLQRRDVWTRRAVYRSLEERGAVKVRAATGQAFVRIRRAKAEQEAPKLGGVPGRAMLAGAA